MERELLQLLSKLLLLMMMLLLLLLLLLQEVMLIWRQVRLLLPNGSWCYNTSTPISRCYPHAHSHLAIQRSYGEHSGYRSKRKGGLHHPR